MLRKPKESPRRPKTPPKRPKTLPRRPQDGPRRSQDAPKTAQDAPKTAQDAAKRTRKTVQVAPKKPPPETKRDPKPSLFIYHYHTKKKENHFRQNQRELKRSIISSSLFGTHDKNHSGETKISNLEILGPGAEVAVGTLISALGPKAPSCASGFSVTWSEEV